MPSARHASRIVEPAGTVTATPSIVSSTAARSGTGGGGGRTARAGGVRRMSVSGWAPAARRRAGVRDAAPGRGPGVEAHRRLTGPPAPVGGGRSRSRLLAVWPRPQIEASRIAWPMSREERQLVVARAGRRGPAASRASSSSWRTVPTRHGTHWPHDSSRKNRAIRRQRADQVGRLVEDHHDARAEGRADRPRALEGQRHVQGVRADEDAGRAAEQHGPDRPTAGDAAGKIDQLARASRRTSTS